MKTARTIVMGAGVMLLLAGAASVSTAQMEFAGSSSSAAPVKDVRPPAPAEPEKANVILPYIIAFVLGGAAIGLAVMPSHRTHQD